MKKFIYTITKRTHNRNGRGYIYIFVSEIREVLDDKYCPIHLISNFKIPTGSNVTSEVMNHLAKIGKIGEEYIYGHYKWMTPPDGFRIWEI